MTKKQHKAQSSMSESTVIVQLLSVIYEPVTAAKFLRCIKSLDIQQQNGKPHTAQSLKLVINKLVKSKTIIEKNGTLICSPSTVESTTRQVVKDGLFAKMDAVIQVEIPLSKRWQGPGASNWKQAVRELRMGIYLEDEQRAFKALAECQNSFHEYRQSNPLIDICFKPFEPEWFLKLPSTIADAALLSATQSSIESIDSTDQIIDWLIDSLNDKIFKTSSDVIYESSKLLILRGDLKRAKALLLNLDHYLKSALHGWILFIEGRNDAAIQSFEESLALQKKSTKKRKVFMVHLSGVFFLLALAKRGTASDIQKMDEHLVVAIKDAKNSPLYDIFQLFSFLTEFMKGRSSSADYLKSLAKWPANQTVFAYLIQVLILSWVDRKIALNHVTSLTQCTADIKNSGYRWLIAECYELLSRLGKKDKTSNASQAAKIRKDCGFETIVDTIQTKNDWERALDAISNLSARKKKPIAKKKSRLIWILSFTDSHFSQVTLKEQKQNAKGGWSSGRAVGLKRLSEGQANIDCLTAHDIRATTAITTSRDYWGVSYHIDGDHLCSSLIGHPLLFLANKNDTDYTPLELVKGSPTIQVIKKGKYLSIEMQPTFSDDRTTALVKETETQWKVIESTPEQRELASLIGDSLKIPVEAKDKVLASMSAIAPFVDIHSDIGGGSTDAEKVDANSAIHLLLSPLSEGLKIEVRTQVFGNKGPYYHPGSGGKTIIAEVGGKRLQTTRDLKLEVKNLQTVVKHCPELSNVEMLNNEWAILDPETCLEVLLELQQQNSAIVSWPEGEKLKINQSIGLADFKMVIKKENNWFSAGGEIKLDDGQVLNMKRLMELTRSAKGRFISLADGQFIALTNTFKNRITELDTLGEEQGDKITLHPLAALALDDMASEVGKLKSDKGWKTYISRFHEAMALVPEVPSTLQAELRDYQKDGFQWLVRLAHWGVGACLADDMGLGKTVQAIALLLHRANDGPALVVAPTSVAMNWMDEIARFSPTLNIIDYRESKRNEVLGKAGNFDIVICSYGLIQNNIKQIEGVKWATVILDEAQAIKNSATKRSQAIMRINADVKIVMTGTPIENHLGELWNLFRFINPGLLGSMESFNSRYANPIVKDESIDTRQKLKKLIHPYMLRRTKTQVLKELPARTEIVLQVEMSKDEAALYEALRRDAVEKFAQSEQTKGHRQLEILAEITRLRRACCNPSLVLKVGAPESSKLALFANVVQELLDNNHKALVFSQFVDHLTILREKLDSMGIKYQYLDGSTPAKKRKQHVNEFQSGIGDIFLISLKAGGVGLNLTAADYVIHMDPWWNPAVEDQASDRAHRIGQKRPVTVYRMITKDTIEEKIVALHKGKRDLADNLLSGTGVASKVNIEELLSLLQEG